MGFLPNFVEPLKWGSVMGQCTTMADQNCKNKQVNDLINTYAIKYTKDENIKKIGTTD